MEDIIHHIKNQLKKKEVDDIVLGFSEREGKHIKFVNNKVVKTGYELTSEISIFCSKDRKIISTSLKDMSKAKADELIKKIIRFSKNVQPSNDYYGIAEGPFNYKSKFSQAMIITGLQKVHLIINQKLIMTRE